MVARTGRWWGAGGAAGALVVACAQPPCPASDLGSAPQRYELGSAAAPVLVRQGHTATLLPDGTVLVAGGKAAGVPQARAERYDPRTGAFAETGSMAVPRVFHTAVLLRTGLVLVHGGVLGGAAAELYDPKRGEFAAAATSTVARSRHTATLLPGGDVLFVGGVDGDTLHGETERYDPTTDTFTLGATLLPRHSHTASLLADGRVLIHGGNSAPSRPFLVTAATDLYDPAADTAEALLVPPSAARAQHTATVLPSGAVLVACGVDASPSFSPVTGTTALFDPGTGSFTEGPPLEPRTEHTASLLPSGLVVLQNGMGDYGFEGEPTLSTSAQLVAPPSTLAATLPTQGPRVLHTATVLPTGNTLFVGGGVGTGQYLLGGADFGSLTTLGDSDLELVGLVPLPGGEVLALSATSARRFDPVTSTYTPTGAPALARPGAAATLLRDGTVLVTGGGSTPTATTELYDPAMGTFTAGPSMSTARSQHTSTLLPSGKVLVVGGSGALQSAELYDPTARAFLPVADATTSPRAGHRAVLLQTGEVLIVGGYASPGTGETFSEGVGFAPTGALIAERTNHTLTLLASGRVLVVGNASFIDVAELYDPGTHSFTASGRLVETFEHSATLLDTGQVLIAGGSDGSVYNALSAVWLFDATADAGHGAFLRSPVNFQRRTHREALLPDGSVLFASGALAAMALLSPGDLQDARWSPTYDLTRRPGVASVPAQVAAGETVSLTGTGFVGVTDASSGTTQASPTNYPIAVWRPLSGQGMVYGSLTAWTDTTAQWTVPATALHGRGRLFVVVNGIPSASVEVAIEPATNSVACAVDADCASGYCADGVCCDARCDGVCEGCTAARKGSGADGVCGTVPPERDLEDDCELPVGASCTDAGQCPTGYVCADGVCCDQACEGRCEACNVPGSAGQCVAVTGVPQPGHGACPAAASGEPCTARLCDGAARDTCEGWVGEEVGACAAASCAAGAARLAAFCDGQGRCHEQTRTSCAPWGCDGDACSDGPCASDDDCHPDFRCEAGDCVPPGGAECDGEHTVTQADGTERDCSPYRCSAVGECLARCGSALNCVQGHACSAARVCIPDGVSTVDAGSCRASGAGAARPWGAAVLLGLALAARRRRRQSARRAPP